MTYEGNEKGDDDSRRGSASSSSSAEQEIEHTEKSSLKPKDPLAQVTRSQNANNAGEGAQRWTGFLIFCNATIVLGSSFMFGYNLSVVNGPFLLMNQWLNESFEHHGYVLTKEELNTHWSIAVTLYLIGGVVGSTWFPGVLSGRLGKKYALIVGAAVGVAGEGILFVARYTNSFIPFMVGRAVVGFQGGLSMVIAPALVNEHAPARLRGACGTLFSLGIAVGLQVANLLGLSFMLGTDALWHYLFLACAGMYLLHSLGLFFIVESPRWLVDQDRHDEAYRALLRLRGASKPDDEHVKNEFEELKETALEESKIKAISIASLFADRRLWWPMFVVIMLHINNELTGLSAVLIYASSVMNKAGLDAEMASIANFGLTFGMVLGNIICALLVDRIGRRALMLLGTAGLVIINVFLTVVLLFDVYQASIAGFALFLTIFTSGPGPVPWFMPAEMFNQAARPLALAVAMFTNWVANIVVSFTFPIMQLKIDYYSFLPFAAIAAVHFVFFLLFLPETTSHLANYSTEQFAAGNSLLQLGKTDDRKNKRKSSTDSSTAMKPARV